MSRKSKLLLTLPLAAAPLMGCDPEVNGGHEVIVAVPLTGDFATRGQQHQSGIQMAIEALQEAGVGAADSDNPFIVTPVNAGNAKEEVAAALEAKIAEAEELNRPIAAVISSTGKGHEGSLKLALQNKIPHFEVSSGSDDEEFLTGDDRSAPTDVSYAFTSRPLCYTEAQLTAEYLQRTHPGNKLALLRGNQAHDLMHTNVIRSELDYYATVLQVTDPVEVIEGSETAYALSYDTNSFQAELESLVGTEAPDVIFYHLRGDDPNLRLLQDASRAGFEGDIVTCGMSRKASLLENERNGQFLEYFADRVHFVMRGPVPSDLNADWKATYAAKYADIELTADTWAASAHDAMMVVGLGLAYTGGEKESALRDAIEMVASNGGDFGDGSTVTPTLDTEAGTESISVPGAGEDIDYDGPSGTMNWSVDGNGDLVTGEFGDPKHYVPGAYYIEVIKGDDDGDGVGAYQVLTDWDPLYNGGDQYWRTDYARSQDMFN